MILCLIPFRIRFVLIVIVPLDWRFLHSEVLILRQKYKIQIRISEIQEITAFRDSKSGSFLSNIPSITEYKFTCVLLFLKYIIKTWYNYDQVDICFKIKMLKLHLRVWHGCLTDTRCVLKRAKLCCPNNCNGVIYIRDHT